MNLPEVCVVYVIRDGAAGDEVLLGRKRRGLGEGKVVAPGGKLEHGESAVSAAVRELREETGLHADTGAMVARGRLDYVFPTRPAWSQRSNVYLCRSWHGRLTGSAELIAEWVPVSEVPYERMWSDARWWLPAVLNDGASVDARFEFGGDLESVVDSDHSAWRASLSPARRWLSEQ